MKYFTRSFIFTFLCLMMHFQNAYSEDLINCQVLLKKDYGVLKVYQFSFDPNNYKVYTPVFSGTLSLSDKNIQLQIKGISSTQQNTLNVHVKYDLNTPWIKLSTINIPDETNEKVSWINDTYPYSLECEKYSQKDLILHLLNEEGRKMYFNAFVNQ